MQHSSPIEPIAALNFKIALLTGAADTPYAFGLATALVSKGIPLDVIAGDDLSRPELLSAARVNFLNLRGSQKPASLLGKILRVSSYYGRLIRYAFSARPKVFHILWNNKLETFDRTLLTLFYKALGKKIVLTAHNVNAGRRDANDSALNRLTLKIQYRLADHIFVHTDKMKDDLIAHFSLQDSTITVIPFGINNAVPNTSVASSEAKSRLGIGTTGGTILFFGTIAPYKGLEYLIDAFKRLLREGKDYRLIIAGRPRRGSERYWDAVRRAIEEIDPTRVVQKIEYISDEDIELYFKAADVLVLPYTEIFQSGVLVLGYSFGLPTIVTDVGSLCDEIIEGETGFVCRPRDPVDLARSIDRYFSSELFRTLASRRPQIRTYADRRYSWDTVGRITKGVYTALLEKELKSTDSARARW